MGKVAVMGAGSWGTVFAKLCAEAGESTLLWARRPEVADGINRDHRNPAYLPDIALPPELRATADAVGALDDAEVVVLAVPSAKLRDCLRAWAPQVPRRATIVSLIKGIEVSSGQRASQIVREVLDVPADRVVVLSGPNIARECALRLPGAAVAASASEAAAARVQAMCHTGYFRVYTNPDLVGVELAGAAKNAIALAAGMGDGLGYGDNSKAVLITRGAAEMTRLGVSQGGHALTFSGLAGVGDLVATCFSRQSRNRHVGEQLGRGRPLEAITAELHGGGSTGRSGVAEGVGSSRALLNIATAAEVEMPIVEHVVKVVHAGMDPQLMVASLMGRQPKPELQGLGEQPRARNVGPPVGGSS